MTKRRPDADPAGRGLGLLRKRETYVCANPRCGKTFEGLASKRFAGQPRCCSQACRSALWRETHPGYNRRYTAPDAAERKLAARGEAE